MQAPAAGGSSAAAAAPQGTAAAQPQPVIPGVAPAHAGAPLAGDPMAAALAAAQQFLGFMSHAGVNPGGFPPGPAPGLFAPPGAPQGPARPGSAAAMFSPDHHQMRPGEGPASRGATPGVGGEMAGATYNRKDKRCAALSAHHHRVVVFLIFGHVARSRDVSRGLSVREISRASKTGRAVQSSNAHHSSGNTALKNNMPKWIGRSLLAGIAPAR